MCSKYLTRKTPKCLKFSAESEGMEPLKKYDVTLTAHYRKTVSVYAESPEQAKEKNKNYPVRLPTLSTLPMMILSAAKPILPKGAATHHAELCLTLAIRN